MYRPDDRWVWDFWTVRDGDAWHLFHLQAPRSVHPDERHWNASIGHAVSNDLVDWTTQPTALEPGPPGAWDDLALWTGSTIRHRSGRWLMAYTGLTREGSVAVERIGLAWSDDLRTWEKDPANPVLESDPTWYERPGATTWAHGWRDPYLLEHGDGYAMLITARGLEPADPYRRGAIALARSGVDAHTWVAGPPVAGTTGLLAQLEVPHLVPVGDRWALVFSTNTDGPWPRSDADAPTLIGTFAMVGDSPVGPFDGEPFVVDASADGSRYAGRVIAGGDGEDPVLMAFADAPADSFAGGVIDPLPVQLSSAGSTRSR